MPKHHESENNSWLLIALFAFAAFIFNTTEFVPIGLLPDIARSFNIDVAHTGLLITIYAWAVTLLSLPFTLLTARMDRKLLLILLFSLFIGFHILSGFAWSFNSLMISRLGVACSHAVFWAITIPLTVRLAPKGNRIKALGFIVTGSSLATVLGVPLGTAIGQELGWRTTFYLIAAITVVLIMLFFKMLPALPSRNSGSIKSLPLLFKRKTLMHTYMLTALIMTGHFAAYTYITPFLNDIGGFNPRFIIAVLFVMGGSGILGSFIYARLAPARPIRSFALAIALMLACVLLLKLVSISAFLILVLGLIWGVAITMVGLALQSKVLEAAPDAADIATSMYSGVFNIGIGGGALVGSQTINLLGLNYIGYIGGIFIALALLTFIVFTYKIWLIRQEEPVASLIN